VTPGNCVNISELYFHLQREELCETSHLEVVVRGRGSG
jgi:hypothetical protein